MFGIVWPAGFLCHKRKQNKLDNIFSLPKNLTLSVKSYQINLYTNIWSNRTKNYLEKKSHAQKLAEETKLT